MTVRESGNRAALRLNASSKWAGERISRSTSAWSRQAMGFKRINGSPWHSVYDQSRVMLASLYALARQTTATSQHLVEHPGLVQFGSVSQRAAELAKSVKLLTR